MLITVTNTAPGNAEIPLPLPLSGSVTKEKARTFNVSKDKLDASESLAGLVKKGLISIVFADDPDKDDAFEATISPSELDTQFATGAKPYSQQGIVRSARLLMSANPADTETVVIGGHTFTFKAALVAAGATTQIKTQGSAANARARLINAINGVVHADIVPATTPFAGLVVADEIDTNKVRLRDAVARGGAAVARAKGFSSIAVSGTVAGAWDRTNLNQTGKAETAFAKSEGSIAITAENITAGKVYIELPFTPTELMWAAYSAAGLLLGACTDTAVIEGNAIRINLAGGGAPALVATNIVAFTATA